MEIRTVNVERFNKAFEAGLRNANFDMSVSCRCFIGSHEEFSEALYNGKVRRDEFFGTSTLCAIEWFCCDAFIPEWLGDIDLCDALSCIANVKRIVEKHHGPQAWNQKPKDERPTLDEFIASLKLTAPKQLAAE